MKKKEKIPLDLSIEDTKNILKKQDVYYDKKYGIENMLYQILNNQKEIMLKLNTL